jgi:UDPglucose 6-dehydrogenase
MRIAMLGSGYVGLVSGACFADFGHHVVCVDSDAERVAALKRLETPIYEPGLHALIAANAGAGRLAFTDDSTSAVRDADVVFIAVGTPPTDGDGGRADLQYVRQAARDIAAAVSGFTVVAVKSTVPVGTCDEVERIIRGANAAADVVVVSNPEFLREGSAIADFKRPDRVIVGLDGDAGRDAMAEVFRPLALNDATLVFTRRRDAELIKYAANAFLAMKVAFINEVADLCEKVDGNVQEVARGVGLDPRIGGRYFQAGPGFGGSCFPKDTLALVRQAQDAASPMRLIETTVAVNEARKRGLADRIVRALGGDVRHRRIGLLGVAFKPNTDDVRDAPALAIIRSLQDAGAEVAAHDPEAMTQAKALVDVAWADSPEDCAVGADALVIVTEWDAFRALDFARLKAVMRSPVLIDFRNIYRREEIAHHGFRYFSVGRPNEDVTLAATEAAE